MLHEHGERGDHVSASMAHGKLYSLWLAICVLGWLGNNVDAISNRAGQLYHLAYEQERSGCPGAKAHWKAMACVLRSRIGSSQRLAAADHTRE
jgi:cytochrome b561